VLTVIVVPETDVVIFEPPATVIVPLVVIAVPVPESAPGVIEVTVPDVFENGKSEIKPFLTLPSVASLYIIESAVAILLPSRSVADSTRLSAPV